MPKDSNRFGKNTDHLGTRSRTLPKDSNYVGEYIDHLGTRIYLDQLPKCTVDLGERSTQAKTVDSNELPKSTKAKNFSGSEDDQHTNPYTDQYGTRIYFELKKCSNHSAKSTKSSNLTTL